MGLMGLKPGAGRAVSLPEGSQRDSLFRCLLQLLEPQALLGSLPLRPSSKPAPSSLSDPASVPLSPSLFHVPLVLFRTLVIGPTRVIQAALVLQELSCHLQTFPVGSRD